MDYDNFGSILTSKRLPTFIPNRINGISGKQLIEGTGISSDLNLEGNGIYAFRNTFSELENVDGLRLGIDKFDNKAKFFIGDPNHFMKWDGENATINGKLYSVEGNIGGWIINSDSLTGTKVKLKSTGEIISGNISGNRVEMDGLAEEVRFYASDGTKTATIRTAGNSLNSGLVIDINELTAQGSFDVNIGAENHLSIYQSAAGLSSVDITAVFVNIKGDEVVIDSPSITFKDSLVPVVYQTYP